MCEHKDCECANTSTHFLLRMRAHVKLLNRFHVTREAYRLTGPTVTLFQVMCLARSVRDTGTAQCQHILNMGLAACNSRNYSLCICESVFKLMLY
jgi:hypothetical protein